jgi:hypothetical protein
MEPSYGRRRPEAVADRGRRSALSERPPEAARGPGLFKGDGGKHLNIWTVSGGVRGRYQGRANHMGQASWGQRKEQLDRVFLGTAAEEWF